jgi:hypothetical protein
MDAGTMLLATCYDNIEVERVIFGFLCLHVLSWPILPTHAGRVH